MSDPDKRSGIAILGSTGSVGKSALQVIARHPERFRVVALTAHENSAGLANQVRTWQPSYKGLSGRSWQPSFEGISPLDSPLRGVVTGPECLLEAATHAEAAIVLNAVVGAAGLPATLAALNAGNGSRWPTRNRW